MDIQMDEFEALEDVCLKLHLIAEMRGSNRLILRRMEELNTIVMMIHLDTNEVYVLEDYADLIPDMLAKVLNTAWTSVMEVAGLVSPPSAMMRMLAAMVAPIVIRSSPSECLPQMDESTCLELS